MKRIMTIAIMSLLLVNQSKASCLDTYESSLKDPILMSTLQDQFGGGGSWATPTGTLISMTQAGLIIAGGATLGIAGAAGGLLVIPVIAFTAIGIENLAVGVSNIKEKKMINLINDSYAFDESGVLPGKNLKKLHRQVNKTNRVISYGDLAKTIIDGNEKETLCSQNNLSMREVKKAIRNGELIIIDSEND